MIPVYIKNDKYITYPWLAAKRWFVLPGEFNVIIDDRETTESVSCITKEQGKKITEKFIPDRELHFKNYTIYHYDRVL